MVLKCLNFPLATCLAVSLWQDLIRKKDKQWLVPSLEAFDNACHTYDLEIFLENFAYFLR